MPSEPESATTVLISAQIPSDLRDAVLRLAARNDRTFSAELRVALRRAVDEHGEAEAA